MNKDTVYIEPEDDITDIIAKIENSKSKIVALIPPKKAGVFRSIVNMKLIAKAGKSAEKSVVLVTMDPSITKLAAASMLPVAKNLQSAPSIPTVKQDIEETTTETVDEDGKSEEEKPEIPVKSYDEGESEESKDEKDAEDKDKDEADEEGEEDEEQENKTASKEKSKKAKKSKRNFFGWFKEHKKLSILLCILILGLIGFLIWALFIAPSVNVFVSIKTETNNFSEAVTFVKELSQENASEGKLYLEERKIETVQEVNFEATGQKNRGEKATGELVVYSYFAAKGANSINAGTIFTISGLSYAANKNTVLEWDGNNKSCENDNIIVDGKIQCLISSRIDVTATEAGTKYNIAKSSTGWDTAANVAAYSDKEMTGGTDDIITVVQQIDIEKARNELKEAKESENKEKLYASIPEDSIILESTFKQDTSAATSTPAIDEEVKEGTKPTLKTTTTTSVYIIDRTKLEEFIRAKVNLPEDKKIYEIRDAYIDGLREVDGSYSGKIKAQYYTGPRLTESELVDKIKGKGLGDARREISDVDGVAEVKMQPSYPWVFVVPTDSNRITVSFEIKDQNGQTVKEQSEEDIEEQSTEKTSENGSEEAASKKE